MTSLLSRLETAAAGPGTITFLASAAGDGSASWARLHEDARGVGAAIQARSIAPGDRLAILGPKSRPLVAAIQATWLSGATTVLPLLQHRARTRGGCRCWDDRCVASRSGAVIPRRAPSARSASSSCEARP